MKEVGSRGINTFKFICDTGIPFSLSWCSLTIETHKPDHDSKLPLLLDTDQHICHKVEKHSRKKHTENTTLLPHGYGNKQGLTEYLVVQYVVIAKDLQTIGLF